MLRRGLGLALAAVLLAGCGQGDDEPAAAPPTTSTTTTPSPTSPSATPTPPRRPGFTSAVRRLTAAERRAMTGVTWRPGCPVPLAGLRHVTLAFRDFEGRRRTGALVVNASATAAVVAAFRALYRLRFPIRRMEPIEAYEGDDFASIEADNTSAFNCRRATDSDLWSHHAYGLAVDVNPLENPYVFDGRTSHPRSAPYLDRTRDRPGVLLADGPAVAAFERVGWHWGGRWDEPVDLQHFSALERDAQP